MGRLSDSVAHSYHPRHPLPEPERVERERKASKQDTTVLRFFQQHPTEAFTPDQVWMAVIPEAPLTSARRAITNLTTRGDLEKLERTVPGIYGHPVGMWRLRRPA